MQIQFRLTSFCKTHVLFLAQEVIFVLGFSTILIKMEKDISSKLCLQNIIASIICNYIFGTLTII